MPKVDLGRELVQRPTYSTLGYRLRGNSEVPVWT